jgi:hypothetical protein
MTDFAKRVTPAQVADRIADELRGRADRLRQDGTALFKAADVLDLARAEVENDARLYERFQSDLAVEEVSS